MADDAADLKRLGYKQELHRGLNGFSNYAVSLSIICILAGGVTSFHQAIGSVGGASIGLGWPLFCLFSLGVALTMGQLASAFPTAGGLYHWASILGGRGWGWATAWFNLAGLLTVLAAINAGTYQFLAGSLGKGLGFNPDEHGPLRHAVYQTRVCPGPDRVAGAAESPRHPADHTVDRFQRLLDPPRCHVADRAVAVLAKNPRTGPADHLREPQWSAGGRNGDLAAHEQYRLVVPARPVVAGLHADWI